MITVLSDHASLAGLEKKDQSQISNGCLVRMQERTRGFNIDIKHVKGSKNCFADALSQKPIEGVECAPDYPLFSNPCVVRAVYGVKGEPDYGVDIQNIAEEGLECDEYREIVEFLKSGEKIKSMSAIHPVQVLASVEDELGVESTA